MTYFGADSTPWFPVTLNTPIFGEQTYFDFNPIYLHKYLYDGPFSQAGGSAWGYKRTAPNTCGTLPLLWAFENVANPAVIRDENGNVVHSSASGFSIDYLNMQGLDAAGRNRIDANLRNGIPTPVGIQLPSGGGHLELVVGWDDNFGGYLILDPAWPRGSLGRLPGTTRVDYAKWESSIIAVLDAQKVTTPATHIAINDDPAPIELSMIGPDGRRTGFDSVSGQTIKEDAKTSYIKLGPWSDPQGETAPGEQGKFIDVRNPDPGTYRLIVTGTGSGSYSLDFTTAKAGQQVQSKTLGGAIEAGQTYKYEVRYTADGQATVEKVQSFTPEARAGNDVAGRSGSPITVSASLSQAIDSSQLSYSWDFGDGGSATGAEASHTYAKAGVYPIRLTVTDEHGSSGIDTTVAYITGSAVGDGKTTERISLGSDGSAPNGNSGDPAITPDGRFVAFTSAATNLSASKDGKYQVYVRDRQSGTTEIVSLTSSGAPGNEDSTQPAMSADGRFVVFQSSAANLAGTDHAGPDQVYVRDRLAQTTELVSVSQAGELGNNSSTRPAINADGSIVAFESIASNLVTGDTNAAKDIFIRDRRQQTTERVSLTSSGGQIAAKLCGYCGNQRPVISGDGRFVAFESDAVEVVSGQKTNYTQVYLRDRQENTTEAISVNPYNSVLQAHSGSPSMSADGRYVAFHSGGNLVAEPDANGWLDDVYVRDRQTGITERVNVSSAGVQSNTHADDPTISPDGRFVAFYSAADNLVAGDTNGGSPPGGMDVFVHDRVGHTTERASLAVDGQQALPDTGGWNSVGQQRTAVANGGSVAFQATASNLVPGDTNGAMDVFLRGIPVAGSVSRPIANPSGPYLGWASSSEQPAKVLFDGSGSSDPGGQSLIATWDFGDGTPPVTGNLVTAHTFAAPGTYTVTLTVDNGNTESDPISTTVEIFPPAPAARVNAAQSCASGGQQISISGFAPAGSLLDDGWNLSSGPPIISAATLTLSWGGTPLAVPVSLSEFSFQTIVTLPAGLDGARGTISLAGGPATSIAVPCPAQGNKLPVADAGGPLYVASTGVPIRLDGSASVDPDGSPLSYTWYYGDGTTGTGPKPEHAYAKPGEYLVTLIVNDGTDDSLPSIGSRSFATVNVSDSGSLRATVTISPGKLWPPNHRLVTVKASIATENAAPGPLQVRLISVTSNEPDNGSGDGDMAQDIQGFSIGTDDRTGQLRAERSGSGSGRIYTLTYQITDAAGHSVVASGTVTVPHNG